MKIFEFNQGTLPILVSMPHNGVEIPQEIADKMMPSALKMIDTDWYMDKVYSFAKDMGCSVIDPLFSRYVIDLNRPDDDHSLYPGADTTELCPTTQFDKQPIYQNGKQPERSEINRRVDTYWRPYHQKLKETLAQLKEQFGFALLFEAHSIKSQVPRFFEGQLPDFNFGNFSQKSSSSQLSEVIQSWQADGYSKAFNGRFKGGYITRHYGNPENDVDSLQLELSQATYMDEDRLSYDQAKAECVIEKIKDLFEKLSEYSALRVNKG